MLPALAARWRGGDRLRAPAEEVPQVPEPYIESGPELELGEEKTLECARLAPWFSFCESSLLGLPQHIESYAGALRCGADARFLYSRSQHSGL